jgi:hypothetical protein
MVTAVCFSAKNTNIPPLYTNFHMGQPLMCSLGTYITIDYYLAAAKHIFNLKLNPTLLTVPPAT